MDLLEKVHRLLGGANQAEMPIAYTLCEAARYLGVSPTSVGRWVDLGILEETNMVRGNGRYVTAKSVERVRRSMEKQNPKCSVHRCVPQRRNEKEGVD